MSIQNTTREDRLKNAVRECMAYRYINPVIDAILTQEYKEMSKNDLLEVVHLLLVYRAFNLDESDGFSSGLEQTQEILRKWFPEFATTSDFLG